MSCCSALELAGAGVAGWVFLEERREDRREGWRCTALLIRTSCLNFAPTAPFDVVA